MSRYVLSHSAPFAEVTVGWDSATGSFFLQCFETSEDDEAKVWKSHLELHELEQALKELKLELPSLLRRVLLHKRNGGILEFEAGDPVLWAPFSSLQIDSLLGRRKRRNVQARVVDVPKRTEAIIEFADGERRCAHIFELEPDLERSGVQ